MQSWQSALGGMLCRRFRAVLFPPSARETTYGNVRFAPRYAWNCSPILVTQKVPLVVELVAVVLVGVVELVPTVLLPPRGLELGRAPLEAAEATETPAEPAADAADEPTDCAPDCWRRETATVAEPEAALPLTLAEPLAAPLATLPLALAAPLADTVAVEPDVLAPPADTTLL